MLGCCPAHWNKREVGSRRGSSTNNSTNSFIHLPATKNKNQLFNPSIPLRHQNRNNSSFTSSAPKQKPNLHSLYPSPPPKQKQLFIHLSTDKTTNQHHARLQPSPSEAAEQLRRRGLRRGRRLRRRQFPERRRDRLHSCKANGQRPCSQNTL